MFNYTVIWNASILLNIQMHPSQKQHGSFYMELVEYNVHTGERHVGIWTAGRCNGCLFWSATAWVFTLRNNHFLMEYVITMEDKKRRATSNREKKINVLPRSKDYYCTFPNISKPHSPHFWPGRGQLWSSFKAPEDLSLSPSWLPVRVAVSVTANQLKNDVDAVYNSYEH